MGDDCATVSKMGEGKSDDFELSLELSIGGGKYEKPENSGGEKIKGNSEGPKSNNFGRSELSRDGPVDMQRRKEIQALRRQEARKKREEKLEKSRKVGFLENFDSDNKKLVFEAQKYQARVEDRGIREKDGFLGEKIRKMEKIGGGEVAKDELGLTLFTENTNVVVVPSQQRENKESVLYPKVQYLANCGGGVQFWGGEGEETVSNRSLEQSSSPVSDYQSTFHKGGSCSDTGSLPRNELDQHFESNDSSCQAEPDNHLRVGPAKHAPSSSRDPHSSWGPSQDRPKLVSDARFFDQLNNNNSCPTMPRPSTQTSGVGLNDNKLVEPVTGGPNNVALPVVHMPCVSTTGNGPNGKTIRGFLYKYTKTEVSIVCVCHGSSFSPAGFVEHAGGVDISHPSRHITIVGPAFR